MAKKKHIVVARTQEAIDKGVDTSKGHLDFKGQTMLYVDDDSIADEIDHTSGLKGNQDVWTHEDPRLNWTERYKADGVHSYIWGASPSFSRAWDDFEQRRKDKKRQQAAERSAEEK